MLAARQQGWVSERGGGWCLAARVPRASPAPAAVPRPSRWSTPRGRTLGVVHWRDVGAALMVDVHAVQAVLLDNAPQRVDRIRDVALLAAPKVAWRVEPLPPAAQAAGAAVGGGVG